MTGTFYHITDEEKLQSFLAGPLCEALLNFVDELSMADPTSSPTLDALLDQIKGIAEEVEPVPISNQRYGNPAFRQLYDRIPLGDTPYFRESFGNARRLDYGTGHELFFVMFLFMRRDVFRMGELAGALVRYAEVARWIIQRYRLEPAGSHGVWGLDDYQHVIFILGAGQLSRNPCITPSDALTSHNTDLIYVRSLSWIMQEKRAASFAVHSPLLAQISELPDWETIRKGLLRMWRGEVLAKFPVIQHLPLPL